MTCFFVFKFWAIPNVKHHAFTAILLTAPAHVVIVSARRKAVLCIGWQIHLFLGFAGEIVGETSWDLDLALGEQFGSQGWGVFSDPRWGALWKPFESSKSQGRIVSLPLKFNIVLAKWWLEAEFPFGARPLFMAKMGNAWFPSSWRLQTLNL